MNYKKLHPFYQEFEISNFSSGKLRLIEPKIEQAPQTLPWVLNHEVVQYMGADFDEVDLKTEQKRIHDIINNPHEYSWMIELDGKLIGNISLNSIDEKTDLKGSKAADLAILIGDTNYWGKSIASNILPVVLNWAFNTADFQFILGRCLQENLGSRRMLEKSGFKFIGSSPYEKLVNGIQTSWQDFELSKQEFLIK